MSDAETAALSTWASEGKRGGRFGEDVLTVICRVCRAEGDYDAGPEKFPHAPTCVIPKLYRKQARERP